MCYSVEAEVGREEGDFKQASSLLVMFAENKTGYLRQINFAAQPALPVHAEFL